MANFLGGKRFLKGHFQRVNIVGIENLIFMINLILLNLAISMNHQVIDVDSIKM